MTRVTITHPGILIFDESGVWLSGWEFILVLPTGLPADADEKKALLDKVMPEVMAAVIEHISEQIGANMVPVVADGDMQAQKVMEEIIKRAKG